MAPGRPCPGCARLRASRRPGISAPPHAARARAHAAAFAALNDTSIKAAVKACKAESGGADNKSATFDCPKSAKVFGPMQGWDTSKVTSFSDRAQLSRGPLRRGRLHAARTPHGPGAPGRAPQQVH